MPILLAYVYGVVPISLCRSGGCGVSTSASGVRIEFDDENDMTGSNVGQTQGSYFVHDGICGTLFKDGDPRNVKCFDFRRSECGH